MAASNEVVSLVVNALSVIASPHATKEARKSSEKFVEDFKNSSNLLEVSLHLIRKQSTFPYEIRVFGLHFLDHILLRQWDTWTAQSQLHFRQSLMSIVSDGLYPFASEKKLIREKLAKLLVNLALRCWPLNWPEFLPFVDCLLSSSGTSNSENLNDIAFHILRGFAEELFLYNSGENMEEFRLQELKAALLDQAAALLRALCESQKVLVARYCASNVNLEEKVHLEQLILSSIRAWAAFVEWIPFKVFQETRIMEYLCEWLGLGELILNGLLEVFLAVVSRPCKVDEQSFIFSPIMQKMGSFLGYLQQQNQLLVSPPGFSEVVYARIKQLAQFLHELGTHQLTYRKNSLIDMIEFMYYLNAMQLLTDHPSDILLSLTLSFWSIVVKPESILFQKDNKHFISALPQLVNSLAGKLVSMNAEAFNCNPYNQCDFDDISEYEQFLLAEKAKICEILKSMTKAKPKEMLDLGTTALQNMLSTVASTDRPYYKSLEGTVCLVESILLGLNAVTDEVIVSGLNNIIHMLLNITHQDLLCWTKLLDILTLASCKVKPNPIHLTNVVNCIMNLLKSQPSLNQSDSAQDLKASVRRKAAGSLVRLGHVYFAAFVPYYDALSSQINQLMHFGDVSQLAFPEKSLLMEFLLLLAFSASSPSSQRETAFNSMVVPVMDEWSNQSIKMNIREAASLLTTIGSNEESDVHITSRQRLSNLLTNSLVILKQLTNSLSVDSISASNGIEHSSLANDEYSVRFVSAVAPSIFALTSSLHGTYLISSWGSAGSIGIKVNSLSKEEKRVLLGYGGFPKDTSDDFDFGPNEQQVLNEGKKIQSLIVQLKIWLSSSRQSAYQWLLEATARSVTYNALGNNYFQAILENGTNFPFHAWKSLLPVVEGFIVNCPQDKLDVLSQWLPSFLRLVGKDVLDAFWKSNMSTPNNAPNNGFSPISSSRLSSLHSSDSEDDPISGKLLDELVHEKLLRATTHAFSGLLLNIAHSVADRVSRKSECSFLLNFILSNESLSAAYLQCLVTLFCWRDTFAVEKACVISHRLLFLLPGRPSFSFFFGRHLLLAAMTALSDGYHADFVDTLLTLVLSIISSYRTDSSATLSNIPSLVPSLHQFLTSIDEISNLPDHNNKKKKHLLKAFLKPILGVQSSLIYREDDSHKHTRNLPTKLILFNTFKKSSGHSGDPTNFLLEQEEHLGLDALF